MKTLAIHAATATLFVALLAPPALAQANGEGAAELTRPVPSEETRSPWRYPRISRDGWRLHAGLVFGTSPRVEGSGRGYGPAHTRGVRALLGFYPVDYLRIGAVGTVGGAEGYGAFGTLGGSIMYTNIKALFRFGVGLNASAILAQDEDGGDQFGWLGVELFPAIELGWELGDRWGLVVTGGWTATKPGGWDYFKVGGKFAAQVEVGL